MISAWQNVTFSQAAQFFSACFSIFTEKSVAVSFLHLWAISLLSMPVPQAHSSTAASGRIASATMRFSALWAFPLMIFTNMPYTGATRSQNMPLLPFPLKYDHCGPVQS